MRAANALTRLRVCAGSSELALFANASHLKNLTYRPNYNIVCLLLEVIIELARLNIFLPARPS